MKCCKCEKYGWEDGLDIVYTDDDGNGYCVFHAPKDEKGISVNEFNELVFSRIDAVMRLTEDTPVNLCGVVFPGDIQFSQACSGRYKKLMFNGAQFNGDVNFDDCVIQGCFFTNVDFLCDFSMRRTEASNELIFESTTFHGKANFSGVVFNHDVSFMKAIFLKSSNFAAAVFKSVVIFSYCNFNDTCFLQPQMNSVGSQIILNYLDSSTMGNLIINPHDIERFKFCSCEAPTKMYIERYVERGLYQFLRNCFFRNNDVIKVEELYRALKQKADKDGDKQLVSKWHYREKRMALRQIPRWLWPLTATGWYGLSSGYGERPVRALGVLLAMIVLTMFCLNMIGIVPNSVAHVSAVDGIEIIQGFSGSFDWTRFGLLAGSTFEHLLFFKAPMYVPQASVATSFLSILTKLLIPIQAALFAFALRNRFRR